MALATLSIDLEAKLAKMEQGFDRANRISEKFAADQERRFQAVKGAAVAIGTALAGAFSVVQLTQFARATIDGLDALNDLKDATGASIENISALEDVAARTGTSFDSMSSTLVKFNKVLGEAKEGSEAANILKQLGLNAKELREIDPAEALRRAAVALAGFADDGDKARIVQELFGKSVQEAAPFLKDLAEQGQLNAKVTTEQAQAAEDFNKQLFALQKNLSDTGRAMVSDLLPALNTFFDRLKGIKEAGGIGAFFGSIGNEFKAQLISEEIAETVRQIELLQKRLNSGQEDAYGRAGLERRINALRQTFLDLQSQAAATKAELLGFADVANPLAEDYGNEGYKKTRGSVGASPGKTEKGKVSELEKYIEKVERAREAAAGLSAEEQAYLDIYLGRLGKVSAEKERQIIGAVRETEAMKKRGEEEKKLQAIIESTPTGKLETLRKTQIALAEAYEKGRFGIVGSEEALKRYAEAVSVTMPEIARAYIDEIDKIDEATRDLAGNIDALLGNGLENALTGNFANIAKDWERMLAQMAIRAAQQNLSKWLLGSDYGSTGYVGGALGNLFGTGGTYPTGGMYDGGGYINPISGGPQSASSGRMSASTTINIGQVGSEVSRGEMFDAITKAVAASEGRQMQRMRSAGVI